MKAHDAHEGVEFERRAPNEGTIDIGLFHQVIDIVGFDASTVKDADALCGVCAKGLIELLAQESVNFLGLCGGGGVACTDSPDGFVGDHDLFGLFAITVCEGSVELGGKQRESLVGLALGETFADAKDRRDAFGEQSIDFFSNEGIRFVKVLASFGVSNDAIATAGGLEHGRRDLARECAFVGGVDVLAADCDGCVFKDLCCGMEGGRGRGDHDFDVRRERGKGFAQSRCEVHSFGDGLKHFPVASDQCFA